MKNKKANLIYDTDSKSLVNPDIFHVLKKTIAPDDYVWENPTFLSDKTGAPLIEMPKIYIASPYTAKSKKKTKKNVNRQKEMANVLIRNGFNPFIPLLYHYQDKKYPQNYEVWLEITKQWMLECDAVLRLSGKSRGADEEVELAKLVGIPVFYSIERLLDFYIRKEENENV